MSSVNTSNWDKKYIDLGTVKVGSKNVFVFSATKNLDISRIGTSCGCSSAKYNSKDKTLTVTFKPNAIPIHLMYVGFYVTSKTIKVKFEDGTQDILSFKAKVIR